MPGRAASAVRGGWWILGPQRRVVWRPGAGRGSLRGTQPKGGASVAISTAGAAAKLSARPYAAGSPVTGQELELASLFINQLAGVNIGELREEYRVAYEIQRARIVALQSRWNPTRA
jgi:hypothetical protein